MTVSDPALLVRYYILYFILPLWIVMLGALVIHEATALIHHRNPHRPSVRRKALALHQDSRI